MLRHTIQNLQTSHCTTVAEALPQMQYLSVPIMQHTAWHMQYNTFFCIKMPNSSQFHSYKLKLKFGSIFCEMNL